MREQLRHLKDHYDPNYFRTFLVVIAAHEERNLEPQMNADEHRRAE
jgi:hypothetical protein